jgi:hypothetical protein
LSRPEAASRRLAVLALGLLCLGVISAESAAADHARVQLHVRTVATPAWLTLLNSWRDASGLSALTENTTWDAGDVGHSQYMVMNDLVTHYETVGTPYYTTAGDQAARNGNIYVSSTTSTTDTQAIDWWMQAPFHALGMMDPRLTSTGFGSFRYTKSGWDMGATLDVIRGNSFSGGQYPVYFPGDGSTEPLTTYSGFESPDPLQACSGYTTPTGLPVFIQVGGNVSTTVGVHTITANGVSLANCAIDSSNSAVGSMVTTRGAVILIPRQPLQNGVTYTVAVTVNGKPYTWSFTVGPLGSPPRTPCTAVTATATPLSPATPGTQVTIAAIATTCPNPRYRFWVQAPGGSWVIAQDYGPSATFVWTSPGVMGTYRLEVDARDGYESVAYDVVTNFDYQLTGCTAVTLGASPGSPQYPSGTVTLTGTPTCVGTPQFRFWIRPPGGAWRIVQDYGPSATYAWSIAGLALGTYGLEVDVRGPGSTQPYQAVANLSYSVVAPHCGVPSLGASPASPGATGGTVTFTASTAGCVNPRYRFWVRPPGGAWTIAQDYSASNSFAWTRTGSAGAYSVEVDVRDALETTAYDNVSGISYALAGCTAAMLTASPTAAAHGTTVNLAATATCPGTSTYRFWVKVPGGSWTILRDYATGSTFAWTPAIAGTYYLEVDVRDQGGTDSYEKVYNLTYAVS